MCIPTLGNVARVQVPLRGTMFFGRRIPPVELAGYFRLSLRDKRDALTRCSLIIRPAAPRTGPGGTADNSPAFPTPGFVRGKTDHVPSGTSEPATWPSVKKCQNLISKISRSIILPKVDEQPKPRLITGRFSAAIGAILTGYITAVTVSSAFWQSPHRFHWILQLDHLLPPWAMITANVALYAWILWLCIVFPRALQGKERVLVAGWIPSLLLSPIQGMVSTSVAAAIQYVKAASTMVAFVVAVVILVEGLRREGSLPDKTVPQ